MKHPTQKSAKALGLCSGGLDSILSALVLQQQGIDVHWICFETPFFSSKQAKKAAKTTGIPLIEQDITDVYMKMLRNPNAGYGKNMNPCMDCHALMFEMAGSIMVKEGYDFLFSGEVAGQRPKSQNKNALRYVEKHSRFQGMILRPLSAKLLPPTEAELSGLVNREKLLDINGRSRKTQMAMAEAFGIKDYPSPAGGCLLTEKVFSTRLKDLMDRNTHIEKRELHFLRNGRHFRLDQITKVVVGRSKHDNRHLKTFCDPHKDVLIKHLSLPGPDVILTGRASRENIETAAMICAAYTKAKPGETTDIAVTKQEKQTVVHVNTLDSSAFRHLMI